MTERRIEFRLIQILLMLLGIAAVDVGAPHPVFILLMITELAIPVLMGILHTRLVHKGII